MKVRLSKPIVGYKSEPIFDTFITPIQRIHANSGDILPVILHNPTHYICDSVCYPGKHIVIFPSQVAEVITEVTPVSTDDSIEEYYNVQNEPKSVIDLENDLPYSTLQSDDESMDQ